MTTLFAGNGHMVFYNTDVNHVIACIEDWGVPDDEVQIIGQQCGHASPTTDEASQVEQGLFDATLETLGHDFSGLNAANQRIQERTSVLYRGRWNDNPIDRTVIITLEHRDLCTAAYVQTTINRLDTSKPVWRAHLDVSWNNEDGITVYADGTVAHKDGILDQCGILEWADRNRETWDNTIGCRSRQFADLHSRLQRIGSLLETSNAVNVVAIYDNYEGDRSQYSMWVSTIGEPSDIAIVYPDDVASCGWYDVARNSRFSIYKNTGPGEDTILLTEWAFSPCAPIRIVAKLIDIDESFEFLYDKALSIDRKTES